MERSWWGNFGRDAHTNINQITNYIKHSDDNDKATLKDAAGGSGSGISGLEVLIKVAGGVGQDGGGGRFTLKDAAGGSGNGVPGLNVLVIGAGRVGHGAGSGNAAYGGGGNE